VLQPFPLHNLGIARLYLLIGSILFDEVYCFRSQGQRVGTLLDCCFDLVARSVVTAIHSDSLPLAYRRVSVNGWKLTQAKGLMSFFSLPWATLMGAVSCLCCTPGRWTLHRPLSPLVSQPSNLTGIAAGTAGPCLLGRFLSLRMGCNRLVGACCFKIFLTRGLQIRSSLGQRSAEMNYS
jgi:hypothetical protein